MLAGIFALCGVALGALLNWLLARSVRRSDRDERRRAELLDLATSFLADADTVWLAAQQLARALPVVTVHSEGWAERGDAVSRRAESLDRAKVAIGRMRIVHPEWVPSASAVLTASELYTARDHAREAVERERAMREFEALVRPIAAS